MKFKITHTTTYNYSDIVPVCHNQVHLTPRNSPGQSCKYHRLSIKPAPAQLTKGIDYFGNAVQYFSIIEGHRKLSVTAISKVNVHPEPPPAFDESPAWETLRDTLPHDLSPARLDAYQYVFQSPFISWTDAFAAYASESFLPGRRILDAVRHLTNRVHADFVYDPAATTVHTPIGVVFLTRRGVCQDLAHVEIGMLRALGLPARYVSGYLRTEPPPGKPRLVGADASHAWLSVYVGPQGWVDFDPTNDALPSNDHIMVAWGRDYGDICPISGMFVAGGLHTMSVSVDVAPLEA